MLVASEEPDADLAKGPIKTRVPGVGRRRSPQSSPLERRPRDIEGGIPIEGEREKQKAARKGNVGTKR